MAVDEAARTLIAVRRPLPALGDYDLLVKVLACGVCRTDLHVIDGELAPHRPAVVPGHEVVGRVVALGSRTVRYAVGDRVGIPWLGATCGRCPYCADRRENRPRPPIRASCPPARYPAMMVIKTLRNV